MFKFNFSNTNNEEINEKEKLEITKNEKTPKCKWLDTQKVKLPLNNAVLIDILKNCEENTLNYKEITMKYLSTIDVLNTLKTNEDLINNKETKICSVILADDKDSDLESAIYEGGMKIWECTFDLLNFIDNEPFNFHGKNVFDLGCGTGLVGLLTLLKDAEKVVFQDYNIEVLNNITIPNIMINNEDLLEKSEFYSGDWGSLLNLISTQNEEEKFDYIFTCETIYNLDNFEKLENIFKKLLKTNGKIYLAAKSYYFGVGGGTTIFTNFLNTKKHFEHKLCWKSTDNEGLRREIIEIKFIS